MLLVIHIFAHTYIGRCSRAWLHATNCIVVYVCMFVCMYVAYYANNMNCHYEISSSSFDRRLTIYVSLNFVAVIVIVVIAFVATSTFADNNGRYKMYVLTSMYMCVYSVPCFYLHMFACANVVNEKKRERERDGERQAILLSTRRRKPQEGGHPFDSGWQ